jgi:hypothetical protein
VLTRVRRTIAYRAARVARRVGGEVGEVGELGGVWSIPADCDAETAAIIRRVQAYTLTPPARLMSLCESIRYLERAGIEGAIVECGVWRGGSMAAAALTLLELNSTEREIWLYDTFTEMPPPGPDDRHVSGADLDAMYERLGKDPVYTIHPEGRIRELLESTGYPPDRLRSVAGLVEETIPAQAPDRIALCRLDTDWYGSTAHELRHLYPRITTGGVLIIDDYGEFLGARKATDEFLATLERSPLLHRVDESCRLLQVA